MQIAKVLQHFSFQIIIVGCNFKIIDHMIKALNLQIYLKMWNNRLAFQTFSIQFKKHEQRFSFWLGCAHNTIKI